MQRVGHKVHDERREHLEQHVGRLCSPGPTSELAHKEVAQVAQGDAHEDTAEEAEQEVGCGVDEGERAGDGGCDGELETPRCPRRR